MGSNDLFNSDEEFENQKDPNKGGNDDDFNADNFGLPEVPNQKNYFQPNDDEGFGGTSDDSSDQNDYGFSDSSSDYQQYNDPEGDEDEFGDEEPEEDDSPSDEDAVARKKKVFGIVVASVLALGIIGGGAYYFLGTGGDEEEEEPATEQVADTPATPEATPAVDTTATEAVDPVVEEKVVEEKPAPKVTPAPKPASGEVFRYDNAQNAYFVVVGSFVDTDLADDYAKRLSKKGHLVYILSPKGGKRGFFRLAVGKYGSFAEANSQLGNFKNEFGDKAWVLKY
ncbi:hypothetical protein FUAX_16940 [Fulvitalea axinellae]|uniref:SPOR domain-containing protein n=1 Tax=Fulvitalea axinellae TaxID=1182444 RepID=A0AAU9CUY1_9BACT|nr:hypothetical protein FUAX_16940 [Fulvitalea axinellae]